jgi:predicted amidohydrolase
VNRSFLIAPDGGIRARYDKIHMFDVQVSPTETYRESEGYRPGDRAVVAEMPFGLLGMTVCYDMRFPALFRSLASSGAGVISVPSAFSPVTGAAHWQTLLRARAIECGAYVLAPAQCGVHATRSGRARETYGHTLAVDPWGQVIADGGDEPGVTLIDLNLELVRDARQRIPALTHDRAFEGPA